MRCVQPSLNQLSDLPHRGQHADKAQRTAANDLLTIHKDGELPVVPLHRLHFEVKVAPQRRRHPGGLNAGDSVTAAADGNSHRDYLICAKRLFGRVVRGEDRRFEVAVVSRVACVTPVGLGLSQPIIGAFRHAITPLASAAPWYRRRCTVATPPAPPPARGTRWRATSCGRPAEWVRRRRRRRRAPPGPPPRA